MSAAGIAVAWLRCRNLGRRYGLDMHGAATLEKWHLRLAAQGWQPDDIVRMTRDYRRDGVNEMLTLLRATCEMAAEGRIDPAAGYQPQADR